MRRNCRIWWPKQLLLKDPSLCDLLFGWFVSCSKASLDIVAAFECNQAAVPDSQSGLEENSMFCLLGQCTAHLRNEQLSQNGMKEEQRKSLMKKDVVDIRNLSLVYTLAGVDCIDCDVDASVVSAVNEGIEAAREIVPLRRPCVMVSINDDEDLHFRKGVKKFAKSNEAETEMVTKADIDGEQEATEGSSLASCDRCSDDACHLSSFDN